MNHGVDSLLRPLLYNPNLSPSEPSTNGDELQTPQEDLIYLPCDILEHTSFIPHMDSNSKEISPERQHSLLLSMFQPSSSISDILMNPIYSKLDINLQLDLQGNSAAHWAASLGKVSLLRLLMHRGANCLLVNQNQETPLIKAITSGWNYGI